MSEEFEGNPPLLAVAVERGGVLVDANDQADAVLEVLVDEGDAVPDAEVGTPRDLGWRAWLVLISDDLKPGSRVELLAP